MFEAAYVCPNCGEEIVVPVDPSEDEQTYVEDCPVCCSPNELAVRVTGGRAEVSATAS